MTETGFNIRETSKLENRNEEGEEFAKFRAFFMILPRGFLDN